jgi:DNA helicase-2/ATP-dependent DNA helicase PcrA
MMSTLELNPEQEAAANHIEGPLLVLAGAGSGKTRVVTHRIGRLIDLGVLPSDILAVTFTNKAADEMRTRIRIQKNVQVLACTFHSLGARILRESIGALGYKSDFAIYDEEDSEKLLKNCLEQLQLNGEKGLAKEMRQQISTAKNNLESPDRIIEKLLAEVYGSYQRSLKECNALDFDDLLYLTVKLLEENESVRQQYQNRWQFVLIDEYQDTNLAQYTLAKLLVEKHQNIFAVGDPDQSIYSWRGARYQNILNFERDFPGAKVVVLDQNYRSTNNILQAANALIEHNSNRYEKKLWSAGSEGEKITIFVGQNERQEAEFVAHRILKMAANHFIPFDDIAIFYRTNAQSRAFEDALLSRRIEYMIIGGVSFYARREIKDILSYLRMVVSNTDLISFLRTINLPKRGLGPAALDKLVEAASQKKMPIFTFCEEHISRPDFAPQVKLSAKQHSGLAGYVRLILCLRNARPTLKIHKLIAELIAESKYLDYLKEDPETMQDRKENVDELIGKAAEWEEEREQPTLQLFLEELTLRSANEEKAHLPSVKLITLHNSKGLEFPLVFLVGLEEDLCPHINSKDNPEAIEEERRLCYVGMTRARKYLYLSASTSRFMWGTFRPMRPSRFLKEIPVRFLQNASPTSSIIQKESSSNPEGFSIGEKVYHQQFGAGVIQKAYHSSFGLTYEVHFPDSDTTRTLAAKFAKLSPYEGHN